MLIARGGPYFDIRVQMTVGSERKFKLVRLAGNSRNTDRRDREIKQYRE